jgi:hypothetical protein
MGRRLCITIVCGAGILLGTNAAAVPAEGQNPPKVPPFVDGGPPPPPPPRDWTETQDAMKVLSFLQGYWAGTGLWPGMKTAMPVIPIQVSTMGRKDVLWMASFATNKRENPQIAKLVAITYDYEGKKYVLTDFRGGIARLADVQVEDHTISWIWHDTLDSGPSDTFPLEKVVITVAGDTWHEMAYLDTKKGWERTYDYTYHRMGPADRPLLPDPPMTNP